MWILSAPLLAVMVVFVVWLVLHFVYEEGLHGSGSMLQAVPAETLARMPSDRRTGLAGNRLAANKGDG